LGTGTSEGKAKTDSSTGNQNLSSKGGDRYRCVTVLPDRIVSSIWQPNLDDSKRKGRYWGEVGRDLRLQFNQT